MTVGGVGPHPESQRAVVRLTEDALSDLHRLIRKDPQIARWCLKKMLLLERNPHAGEALLGGLIGFRKLTVGNRDWRVIWRVAHDQVGAAIVEVAEVSAAGARPDAAVYEEMVDRVARLGTDHRAIALTQVLESLGRVAAGIAAEPEPKLDPVPDWLVSRLVGKAGHTQDDVRRLTPEQAMQAWEEWISRSG